MEPVSKDLITQKNIASEIEKVKKAMQVIGDESYQTFFRINQWTATRWSTLRST